MKKKSPPYAIIIAAVFGIIAVIFFVQYTKKQEAQRQAELAALDKKRKDDMDAWSRAHPDKPIVVTPVNANTRPVLYATQPMDPGVKVSPSFYEKKQTPTDILPDAFTSDTDITGWIAIRRIEKGDPLTPRNIGKSLASMAQRIGLGMRAIALPVFSGGANNTGGFVVDGDRVDLLFTFVSSDEKYRLDTRLVMQNLQVLYVPGPQNKTEKTEGVTPVGTGASTITFEVTPEQAQALVFMSGVKNGQFNMILRAKRDNKEIKIKPFVGADYVSNFGKIQKMTDKSFDRVNDLSKQIEAEEKALQGTTNETTTPTPPKP